MSDYRQATETEVRRYFQQRDCEVCITRDGRVTFRQVDARNWLDGRYLQEYLMIDGTVVHT